KTAYPDPTADEDGWVAVDLKAGGTAAATGHARSNQSRILVAGNRPRAPKPPLRDAASLAGIYAHQETRRSALNAEEQPNATHPAGRSRLFCFDYPDSLIAPTDAPHAPVVLRRIREIDFDHDPEAAL